MSPTDETPRAVPPPAILPHPAPAPWRGSEGPTGAEVARILVAGRWIILGSVALAVALAGAYLLVATPRWRAEALLRIEERVVPAGADPIVAGLDVPPAKAEVELLRARTLVEEAVERLGLDVVAVPRRVPFLGKALARFAKGEGPAPARLGLERFAWGGERIAVERLELPERLVDVPLVLTAQDDGGYALATAEGEAIADGAVGRLFDGKDAAGSPVRVLVSELVARPRTQFLVRKLRTASVAAGVQLQLTVEERGKETGIVGLRLEGPDRARVAATLGAILQTYLRQNAERASARAARTLALLERRLPDLKANIDRAETAVEAWKRKNGTVDVTLNTQALLARSVDADRRIADLEAKREELSLRRYTDDHPGLGELADQLEALRIQRALIEAKLRAVPAAELQMARLSRDVHAATALYLQVLERTQQFRIAAAGAVGSASVVDAPSTPGKPVPQSPVMALALLVGLVGGALGAVIRSRMGGAGDAVDVEVSTGLSVLGTVPHTSTESSLVRTIRRRLTGGRAAALHAVDPGDVAVEDLRSLRTNISAALRGARSNVVAIGGPAPGVGKSFVCLNLALLLGSPRRKVLLIDADLRRGRLNREFGLERTPGLSEVLAGTSSFDAAVQPSGSEGLDLLAAGELPEDPTALLEGPGFEQLLADAGKRYDVVLVDTAAILAVTDPALVARHAGLSLLVLRAGEHPPEEIALAVKRLRQSGARVDGAILNDVRPGRHARYHYDYRSRARAGA